MDQSNRFTGEETVADIVNAFHDARSPEEREQLTMELQELVDRICGHKRAQINIAILSKSPWKKL